jgi:hypothetical protein
VHVAAARSALNGVVPARQAAMEIWNAIRARVPLVPSVPSLEPSEALDNLNARVRAVFDPHGVFLSPAMNTREELAHV